MAADEKIFSELIIKRPPMSTPDSFRVTHPPIRQHYQVMIFHVINLIK